MNPYGESPAHGANVQPSDEVLLARAFLSRVCEPANLDLITLVAQVGPVKAAELIRAGAIKSLVSATVARLSHVDPAADIEAAFACGVRLVVPESNDWPAFAVAALEHRARRLAAQPSSNDGSALSIPPIALWVAGDAPIAQLGFRSVAMVGARAASAYGEQVATDLAYQLASRDVTIISGGAFGIDTAAHRGALAARGNTVLVSAAGLDRVYPLGNARLFAEIRETGLLISESPPGVAPQRQRFLSRNRLIAAFAQVTVVVEAARRSGALNTARHARDIGRSVLAVPGPITSALSTGTNALIQRDENPARLVTGVDDILEYLDAEPAQQRLCDTALSDSQSWPDDGPAVNEHREDGLRERLDCLDPLARSVFEALPACRSITSDEIARRSGVSAAMVMQAIPELIIADLVESQGGGWRITKDRRG